jgi:hypothetical protein
VPPPPGLDSSSSPGADRAPPGLDLVFSAVFVSARRGSVVPLVVCPRARRGPPSAGPSARRGRRCGRPSPPPPPVAASPRERPATRPGSSSPPVAAPCRAVRAARCDRLPAVRRSVPSTVRPWGRSSARRGSGCWRRPPIRAVRVPVAPPSAVTAARRGLSRPVVTPSSAAAARLPMDPSAPLLCIVRPPACELRPSCWPSICCSHEPFPSGDIFPPLLVSSLLINHILCCSFVLFIWERTEEWIICHLCYCFALMWPLISVAVVQASCFLGLPLMVMRLQYAPISFFLFPCLLLLSSIVYTIFRCCCYHI